MTNPAKAYLMRYRALRARYASLCREIERLRESLTGTTVQLKADPVSSSGGADRMAATVAKMVDLERSISGETAQITEALEQILTAIRAVPDEMQRTVLTLRYVEGLDWIRISENIHYGERQTFVVHGRALVAVNQWLAGMRNEE